MQLTTGFFALASLLTSVKGATYSRTDRVAGEGFNDFFEYQAIADPTNGRVNYVDQATAQAQNLTYGYGDTFVLRADSTNVVAPGSRGRNSVRIRSRQTFTTHVATFDIRHMPQGCGTWPAVWETLEDGWPVGGETDIVEGVNDQGPNAATLHTTTGCTMPADTSQMTGSWKQLDCDWLVNGNAGCGVRMSNPNSYGPGFNANGGGVYALERTNREMKVWFFPRGTAPTDIGTDSVNTDAWGTPAAYFPSTQCDFDAKFAAHNIIINLTLCGDWAGSPNVYPGSCPQSCISHVDNNPGAFREAFWDFASINVYQ